VWLVHAVVLVRHDALLLRVSCHVFMLDQFRRLVACVANTCVACVGHLRVRGGGGRPCDFASRRLSAEQSCVAVVLAGGGAAPMGASKSNSLSGSSVWPSAAAAAALASFCSLRCFAGLWLGSNWTGFFGTLVALVAAGSIDARASFFRSPRTFLICQRIRR
jgi:hypothetical protein